MNLHCGECDRPAAFYSTNARGEVSLWCGACPPSRVPVTRLPRLGEGMLKALRLVADAPGVSKRQVAMAVAGDRRTAHGFETVDRAIASGLLAARGDATRYHLTVAPLGRAILQGAI